MRTKLTLGAISIISLALMLMTFHDAEYALGISLTVIAIIYFPLGYWHINGIGVTKFFRKAAYQKISSGNGIITFLVGFVLSMLVVGCTLKVLQLPGYGILLYIGHFAALLFFILLAIIYPIKKNDFPAKLMGRLII